MKDAEKDQEAGQREALYILQSVYKERAAEEALLRALGAERSNDRTGAVFWIKIISAITD